MLRFYQVFYVNIKYMYTFFGGGGFKIIKVRVKKSWEKILTLLIHLLHYLYISGTCL